MEDEVEHNIRSVVDDVESSLSAEIFPWGSPEFVLWRTPFYDVKVILYHCMFSYVNVQLYLLFSGI